MKTPTLKQKVSRFLELTASDAPKDCRPWGICHCAYCHTPRVDVTENCPGCGAYEILQEKIA